MAFKNFSIWRGRLPHWRADDVTYYVTFRHRRALDEQECVDLLRALLKADGRTMEMQVVCVLPESTEMLFTMADGEKVPDLAKIVEGAKRRMGAKTVKRTGEMFAPFYNESYDRIVRDESEYEERFTAICRSPVDLELCEAPDEYEGFWSRP